LIGDRNDRLCRIGIEWKLAWREIHLHQRAAGQEPHGLLLMMGRIVLLLALLLIAPASAQDWPSRHIRLVVPCAKPQSAPGSI
jgi:hypothetical protein